MRAVVNLDIIRNEVVLTQNQEVHVVETWEMPHLLKLLLEVLVTIDNNSLQVYVKNLISLLTITMEMLLIYNA